MVVPCSPRTEPLWSTLVSGCTLVSIVIIVLHSWSISPVTRHHRQSTDSKNEHESESKRGMCHYQARRCFRSYIKAPRNKGVAQ